MSDEDGPAIAEAVYRRLLGGEDEHLNPDDIPYALDEAVEGLRRRGVLPSIWAPYIHIGI